MVRILLASVIHPTSEVEGPYPDLGLGYLAATLRQELATEIDIRIVTKDYRQALAQRSVTNEMDCDRLNVNFEISYHNLFLLSQQLTREEILNIY
jgi:hypothetical protein